MSAYHTLSSYSRRKQNLSPFQQSGKKSQHQQLQIQELQQKVDIILNHNEQLIEKNNELKKLLAEGSCDNKLRLMLEENQMLLLKLRKQLDYKCNQNQDLSRLLIYEREIQKKQIDSLTKTIKQLTDLAQQLQKENKQLLNLQKTSQDKSQIDTQKARNQLEKQYQQCIEKLKRNWQQEKQKLFESKLDSIAKLEQSHQRQKKELLKKLEANYKEQIKNIENQVVLRCKIQRQNAQQYITKMLGSAQTIQDSQNVNLKKQIEILKQSLDKRKNLLLQMAKTQDRIQNNNWFDEMLKARQQTRNLAKHYLRQSQLLKLQLARQHQLDVQELANAYEKRFDLLALRITYLQNTNSDLRKNFEDEITRKISMKKKFEIEVSKLRNYIKKLKIDLNKMGDDMTISIQNIRNQSNTISSQLIVQIANKKAKETFAEEEAKRLRQLMEKKDSQYASIEQQCKEKIKYYNDKITDTKSKLDEVRSELAQKQKQFEEQLINKQRDNDIKIEKQKIHCLQMIRQKQQQMEKAKFRMKQCQQRMNQLEVQLREKIKDCEDYKYKLQSANAHIQALKLELDIKGTQDQNDEKKKRQAWKNMFQRKIAELQQDKVQLQHTNSTLENQMTQLVLKYKELQNSLQKTVQTMKKRTDLQRKVVEIGLDNNLVKNLAELFCKQQ